MRKVEYIKVEDLKDGYTYRILARNAKFGIWKKDKESFVISRWKFGENFTFEELHWDTSNDFGTVKPLFEIEKSPFSLWEEMGHVLVKKKDREYFTFTLYSEVLEYLNKFEVSYD